MIERDLGYELDIVVSALQKLQERVSFLEAASAAKPAQPVTASASGCPDAGAAGNQELNTSSHCPDEAVRALAAMWRTKGREAKTLSTQLAQMQRGQSADVYHQKAVTLFDCATELEIALQPGAQPAAAERARPGNDRTEPRR